MWSYSHSSKKKYIKYYLPLFKSTKLEPKKVSFMGHTMQRKTQKIPDFIHWTSRWSPSFYLVSITDVKMTWSVRHTIWDRFITYYLLLTYLLITTTICEKKKNWKDKYARCREANHIVQSESWLVYNVISFLVTRLSHLFVAKTMTKIPSGRPFTQ